jgi:hypothetical protein
LIPPSQEDRFVRVDLHPARLPLARRRRAPAGATRVVRRDGRRMLVLLQFPIADMRSFVDAPDTRLRAAIDFAAIASQQGAHEGPRPYIRHMGPLRRRQQGLDVAGEIDAFRGRGALRWPPGLASVPHPRDGGPVPMRLLFRRFQPFTDGRSGQAHRLARYEIGWLLDATAGGRLPPGPAELDRLLDACLALPVSVAQYDADDPSHRRSGVPLSEAGPLIARQLRWAMAARPRSRVPLPEEWTLQACKPALLIEFGSGELDGDPAGAVQVVFRAAPEVRLHCRERRVAGQALQCWYARSHRVRVERTAQPPEDDPLRAQQMRNLRVAVLRQHAEREVLAGVLGCIALPGRLDADAGTEGDPTTIAGARLREYLLSGAALLARRNRRQGQLPIGVDAGDEGGLAPAAEVVDQADAARRRSVQHQLSVRLGAQTMAALQQALELLPMGSLEADETVAALAAANRPPPLNVAVSYAHKDERDARLLSGLRDASHRDALEGVVKTWTDCRIEPGDDWRQEILDAFRQADVLVLLLSPAFLASSFCMEQEVPLALDLASRGEAAVLPVEAISCDWSKTPIAAKLQVLRPWNQALVSSGNRLAAWSVVRHAVYRAAVRAQRRSERPSA